MPKKIFGVAVILAGVLIFAGAGCALKKEPAAPISVPTAGRQQVTANLTNAGVADVCNEAKEIEPPNDLAKELKEIISEAGGEAMIVGSIPGDSLTGDAFIFIWKDKLALDRLEDVFKKHGYKIEVSGDMLIITKNGLIFNISLTDKGGCQQIVITVSDGPFKKGGTVTRAECEKLLELAKSADIRNHRIDVAWANAIKLYNYWLGLAAKYGVAKEAISDTCENMLGYK